MAKVDLLDEDRPIAEQRFACLSFVSPEYIIKNKNLFLFESFVKEYEFSKTMEKFTKFINFISYKYNIKSEDLHEQFKKFVDSERDTLQTTVEDDYKNFIDNNEKRLEEDYARKNEFQTSVRGIKVRGVFPTQEEAELRCKMLRNLDPNHDVYVGPVGIWMPFHPEAYKTGRVEYMEEELNQLMHEKEKNEYNAKASFEKRVKETKQKAIEENIKAAEKSGNILTQTIDEEGNLVGVNNANTQEFALKEKENISTADICMELFEGDNVVVGKTDNGQSLLVSGPFANKNK
jgi:hypothetical protein